MEPMRRGSTVSCHEIGSLWCWASNFVFLVLFSKKNYVFLFKTIFSITCIELIWTLYVLHIQMENKCIFCKSVYDRRNYYQFSCSHVLHYTCAQEILNNDPGFYSLENASSVFYLKCPACEDPVVDERFDFKTIEDDFSIMSKICKEKFSMELHIIDCHGDANKLKTSLSKRMNDHLRNDIIFQYRKDNDHLVFFCALFKAEYHLDVWSSW